MKFLSLALATLLFSSLSHANISFNNFLRQWAEKPAIVERLSANDWVLVGEFSLTKSEADGEPEVYRARLPEERAGDAEFIDSLGIQKELLVLDIPLFYEREGDEVYFIPRHIQLLETGALVIDHEKYFSYWLHFPISSQEVHLALRTISGSSSSHIVGELRFSGDELHLVSNAPDNPMNETMWVFTKVPAKIEN